VPEVEPIAPETSDEDDTARINRTLQIDAVAGDGELVAAATGDPTAPTGLPLPTPGAGAELEPTDPLPPPDREVFVDGKPLGTPPLAATATVPPATPIDDGGRGSGRMSKAALAFWAAIVAIAVTVVVVIVLAVTGGDDGPPATTTTSSTSTSSTSTSTTSTTAPSTTAAPTTAPAGATTAPGGAPTANPPLTVAPTSPTAP
jgi:hypothetical protein